jgi:hypothetical protein
MDRCASRLALAALPLLLGACLLPMRIAPPLEGRVVDASSGEPLAGAVVVARFDGRYGEMLPDRELLGHAEVETDAAGRFRFGRKVFPGIQAWPYFETEVRIAAVIRDGYRCGRPLTASPAGATRVALVAALDEADQRESCRPVAARRGEAVRYMAAWAALHDEDQTRVAAEQELQLQQLLAARAVLGFGENCEGPAFDLALAPGGRRVGVVAEARGRRRIQVVAVTERGPGPRMIAGDARNAPPRRLAWTGPDELVLWEPASRADRTVSPSIFARGKPEVVWTPATPPANAADAESWTPPPPRPLEPEDLNDEAETRWRGRSFALLRTLDSATGLARERLRIAREDGSTYTIDLPGEACGPRGSFGHPHYRIAADGRTAFDLRHVDGGCHAVWVDLESGRWATLDASRSRASCRTERRIPPGHLGVALRGYLRQMTEAMKAEGADPNLAYVIRIDAGGETSVEARQIGGGARRIAVPRFPVTTPLRAIHVANVAPPRPIGPPPPEPRPL